jgi:hypothetical protein
MGWVPLRQFAENEAISPRTGELAGDCMPGISAPGKSGERLPLVQKGYTRVHLIRANSGYLNIHAKIDGTEVNLVLDTGAPQTHLDRKRVEQLKLKWDKPPGTTFTGTRGEWGDFTTVDSIQLGAFRTAGLLIHAHDLSETNRRLAYYGDRPIDGVLGADVLDRAWAVIDYKMNDLFLLDRNSPE